MAEFSPLVSVVIPVYNGADYVKEAIDSALAQTYSHREIVVVNDGSTDDGATDRICRSYGDRIRYFDKPNGGVATALNLGIEKMRGEYFSWLSHDDLYRPEKLSRQIDLLRSLDDRNVVLYSDYDLVDEKSELITSIKLDHQMLTRKPLYAVLRGSIHGCSTLVPRAALAGPEPFSPDLATTQDYALWFSMARKHRFVHMPLPLIASRWHPAQGSKTHPATLREANELWIGFAQNLSEAEMLRCEPSVFGFYSELAKFLSNTPYEDALRFVADRADQERERVGQQLADRMVSVIVPVHNRIPLAVQAVHSVLMQSHQNLEVLVIDNLSTEPTEPLRELGRDQRVRVLECTTPGASAARNLGIAESRGEFVAFLDADDLWEPDKVNLQLAEMALHGHSLSFTDYETFGEGIAAARVDCRIGEPFYPNLVAGCPIATPTVMLRKSILNGPEKARFREDLRIGEDVCLWLDLARHQTFAHIPQPLTQVRRHSQSAALDRPKQVEGLLSIVSHLSARDALLDAPLETCHLLKCAYWVLEDIAAEQLLEQAVQGTIDWPEATALSRLANRIGARYASAKGPLRKPLKSLAVRALLRVARLRGRERPWKERTAPLLAWLGKTRNRLSHRTHPIPAERAP